ncbi:uncharacterized protein LOC143445628 [Clavelina lepadiformis]|uniref:uncharacterized protein LOC143445628 n=1 Tax=Clavelina lepadiformis TaxID=159417 RepID=UPI004041291F
MSNKKGLLKGQPVSMPPGVGSHYKLLETIGTGAYGVVYSAIDTKQSQHVAIKKIVNPFDVLMTAKRTLRELKLLLHFKHDNVVAIKDIIQTTQNIKDVYVVMDLMESDLHNIIRSDQLLTAEHICYFLYQLLRGLKYIHSANVIHRDLKPSNLLVNENCELKIGDFGMAKGVSRKPEDHKMFMTEYVATRWYRAPELMLSIGEYSQSIDMWSVGCIFAEMIGRKQIFPGRHYVHQLHLVISILGSPAQDLVKNIKSDRVRNYVQSLPRKDPVQLKTLYPKATERMLELLYSFLQFDPDKRPTAEHSLSHSFFGGYHDNDDEPICHVPFDFRFEDSVTKDEVRNQVKETVERYHERKNRLSKQLTIVTQVPASKEPTSTQATEVQKNLPTNIISNISISDTSIPADIFKKPLMPSNLPRGSLIKPVSTSQSNNKSSSDNVNMKSATSISSMDMSVELEQDVVRKSLVQSGTSKQKDNNRSRTVESVPIVTDQQPMKPMITVQVVQDDPDSLSEDSSEKDESSTKQVPKPKREDKRGSKNSQNQTKKTTISENTKMKIRDTIFASMFAKQNGLGKSLDKVRKSVTAAERQKEREEKRKKRQERAAEKEKKKREEEAGKKNELSDADRILLQRWTKMQVKSDQGNKKAVRSDEKSDEQQSVKKNEKSVVSKTSIGRHKSLPASTTNPYRQHGKFNEEENRRNSVHLEKTLPNNISTQQLLSNQLITVVLDGKKTQLVTNAKSAPLTSKFTEKGTIPLSNFTGNHEIKLGNHPLVTASFTQVQPHIRTLAASSQDMPKIVPVQYHASLASIDSEVQQGYIAESYRNTVLQPSGSNLHLTSNQAPQVSNSGGTGRFITVEEGGVFIPESEATSQSTFVSQNKNSTSALQNNHPNANRPTTLFPLDSNPKVLIDNQLMTPGTASQQSGLIATTSGKNLATLSPDTIDYVLNENFQKHSTAAVNHNIAKQRFTQNNASSLPSHDRNIAQHMVPTISTLGCDVDVSHTKPYVTQPGIAGNPSHSSEGTPFSFKHLSNSQSQDVSSNSLNVVVPNERDESMGTSSSSSSSFFKQVQQLLSEKKQTDDSSLEFSPGSFLKSLDGNTSNSFSKSDNKPDNIGSISTAANGGIFLPHIEIFNNEQNPMVEMSENLPSAGAASTTGCGYGLGVDITDIIPQSAGDQGLNSNMDCVGSAEQPDSSLLADWLDVHCLQPQDMEALQRELELGSPMSVDGS